MMKQRERNKIMIALLIAPPLIGFEMLRDMVQDYRLAIENWDVLLLFFVLPYAAAAILLLTKRNQDRRALDAARSVPNANALK